jgi:TonB-linked SusC/RagA family outer membrane protein
MQLTANVRKSRYGGTGKSGLFIRSGSYANGFNRKLLRGMKLTATLLLITCLHAAAHMKGQTVTLSLKNVPVQKVFREVSRQTGISIVYNEGMFEGLKPVTIKVNQMAIKDVLELCFQGQPFEYNLLGNTIVIKKKPVDIAPFAGILALPPPPPVKGKVLNENGEGIAGANVQVKGSRKGTTTDANGEFSIEANKGDKLIISYVGYSAKEITVGDDKTITISLALNTQNLGELVVTALGIQRRSKSLTYSTQKVTNADLTTVKDINPINSLNGKVAGLQINRSASGLGGSARVVLRGQKSTRENQPLFVIDGVPMANIVGSQPTDVWGQSSGINSIGRDGGDVLSTINPEDIESITVLKGASAAALYGSQAGNGVILITTKKGKSGTAKIDFSSNFTVEKPMYHPELQYDYKQTGKDNIYSWGDAQSSPDHVKPFFETGSTWINTLSLTAGNEKAQTYFSYSNTNNKGILPTSELDQHTFNFRETAKFLNDKLTVDANILFSTQKVHNRPSSGLYFNALTGLYLFPRGLDFNSFQDFQYYSPLRNLHLQNWWNINYDKGAVGQDNQQNPYWVLHRNLSDGKKDNLFSSITLKYPLTKWLNVQARGSINRNYDNYEFKAFAGTQITLADSNGRYTVDRLTSTLLYGDLIFSGNAKLTPTIGFNFNAGTSINDLKQDRDFFDTKGSDLRFANIFTLSNVNLTPTFMVNPTGSRRQVQSIFATTTFDYDDKVYLDLTARNDWSSTLAYTPKMNSGYTYFSAGLNTIITDLLQFPALFDYGKLRLSYAKVGNDVAAFATLPTYGLTAGNTSIQAGPYRGNYLKPEDTRSFEIGTEWRMLSNRLNLDFTWYKSNTKDQYFEFNAPLGSGLSKFFVNAGDIENKGIELTLSYEVIRNTNLKWTSSLNLTRNRNKVIKLLPELGGQYDITMAGVNNYSLRIREGGSFGDIYGKKFMRANDSSIIVDDNGRPQGGAFEFLGNPNPKFMAGWSNTIQVKDFIITALIDGRFGGKVMSITQAILDEYGVSKVTADARRNGGVQIDATKASGGKWSGAIPAETFYTTVGGRAGITEYYMYDATNVRLRELSVSYKLPMQSKTIKDIRLGLVARNLFFITKEAPYDPELSMSTGNGLQGIDVFSLPATRSFGLSVRCSF